MGVCVRVFEGEGVCGCVRKVRNGAPVCVHVCVRDCDLVLLCVCVCVCVCVFVLKCWR